ncbi:MAG TPA: dihydrofolate reductase family protein [Candidatus Acidoferrales bacterium]|nr:dihydrofolate reductase family protein [Candidatus Acidoferrales bacterium]
MKYGVGVSLDGYIAAPDGSVDWLERATRKAKGEDFGMGEFFRSIDTVLMGRKTYEIALKMGMGKGGYSGMRNYVFSRTLPPGERDGVEFVSGDPAALMARLKQQPGKDIWLCGGGELTREFLKAGALDEIILGIVPVLIGAGRPTFPPEFPETEVELVDVKQYKGGVMGLTYRVLNAAASKRPTKRTARSRRRARR